MKTKIAGAEAHREKEESGLIYNFSFNWRCERGAVVVFTLYSDLSFSPLQVSTRGQWIMLLFKRIVKKSISVSLQIRRFRNQSITLTYTYHFLHMGVG